MNWKGRSKVVFMSKWYDYVYRKESTRINEFSKVTGYNVNI